MRWDYLFNEQVLAQGKEYYQTGCVGELLHRGGTYQAKVVGSKKHDVEVYLTDRVHPRLYCDCRDASGGRRCRHMAAVLYAIAEEEGRRQLQTGEGSRKKEKDVPKRIYPFSHRWTLLDDKETVSDGGESDSDEYEYFDLKEMTRNFVFYEDSCEAALKMIREGRIVLEGLQMGYPDKAGASELIGIAEGSIRTGNAPESEEWVTVCFDKENIRYAECGARKCYYDYNNVRSPYDHGFSVRKKETRPCVHVIGLLLLLQKRLREGAVGDATDSYAQRMLYDFRNLRAWNSAEEEPDKISRIQLEPTLELDYDGLKLGARMGKDKLYQVKSLPMLVSGVEAKERLALGTKTEIDLSAARFDDRSEKFYQFIRQAVTEERRREMHSQRSFRAYENIAETIKGKLFLYGKRLDDFFEMVKGERIQFADKSSGKTRKTMLQFQEADPEIELVLTQETDEKGVFQGVRIRGNAPELFMGLNHQYYFAEDSLNRIDPEKLKNLQPLLETAEDGEISMQVGRRYLSEFYYRVLPILKEYATVTEQGRETIQKYLPPEVEFVFYLDAEQKNITCRAKARYGDVECDVMDWLKGTARKERFRDVERETGALGCVQQLFPEEDVEKGLFHCGEDVDRIYTVLESGIGELMRLGEVQTTDSFRRLRIRKAVPVTVGVSIGSGIMDLEICSEELSQEELLDILNHYRRKKKYYRLKNGDFLNLEEQSLEELAAMLEAMHVSPKEFVKGKMQLPLYRALYLDKMLEQCDGIYTSRDSHFKKLIKNFKTVEDSEHEIPGTLRPVMRKYQKHGYRWLCTLESSGFGGILADDMGLGKTLQVIAVLLAARNEGKLEAPALIVTPASLVYNWQEEFTRFAPELSVGLIVGSQAQRREILNRYKSWDVLVTSYDLLKRDIADYEGRQFSYQVIDEAQFIKNHSTAAAKSVKIVKSRVKYALTGTPIENRLSELWSIFDYLMPGFLYGYETFKKELETPIVKNQDADAAKRLKRMVSPFILRRLKGDVLKDLPEKLEETYYAKMEEKQQQLYDGQVVHMRKMLEKQTEENYRKNKIQVLAELTKLRQICCDPSLLFEDYGGESAKRAACMDLIRSAIEGEHKILLFSQFVSMLELLEEDLVKQQIPYYKITGETAKEKRLELVRSFNTDPTPLFLISLKAGGTGLNLTGADIVIHYDPWWNLAVQDQATDRAHRIGQTRAVSVYKLIMKDSIEEKILRMQEEKRNLAEKILSGENGGIVSMSREDLLELLG
ncbi:MAG: DEAD/DEAH box helicase [Muribaculaceae bacterium]|nr:DEAD/DEAH box helicase [Muribaculaceae bacterium]